MNHQALKYTLLGAGGAILVGGGVAIGIVLGTKDNTSTQNSAPVNLEVVTTSVTSVIESSAMTETVISTAVTLVSSSAPTSVVTAQTTIQTTTIKEITVAATKAPVITQPEPVYEEPEEDESEEDEPEPVTTKAPTTTKVPATTKSPETLPVIKPKEVVPEYDIADVPFVPNTSEDYPSWYDAYANCIYNAVASHEDDSSYQTTELDPFGYAFDLADLNADGTPELLISSGVFQYADLWLYTYADDALGVDIMLRIHCDSSDNPASSGTTLYVSKSNAIAKQSKTYAEKILPCMTNATGAKNNGVRQTDTYTGNNWATVPCILMECGFMSNPEEDVLLNSADYQQKLTDGIVNGLLECFEK